MASPHDLPMDNQSLFTQRMVLVYNIFCEAFVSEPDPPELPAKIIACISIVTFLFLICNHILNVTLAWLLGSVIPENDLEGGDIIYGPRIDVLDSSPFRIAIVQNTQRLGVMTRVMPDFDEGRGPRLRALKKLPPLLNYGSCEIRSTSSSRCTACAICLEDFADGDSCQIFSLCNHMFHSNCIDHWLMNKSTCPVCRNCIMDV